MTGDGGGEGGEGGPTEKLDNIICQIKDRRGNSQGVLPSFSSQLAERKEWGYAEGVRGGGGGVAVESIQPLSDQSSNGAAVTVRKASLC